MTARAMSWGLAAAEEQTDWAMEADVLTESAVRAPATPVTLAVVTGEFPSVYREAGIWGGRTLVIGSRIPAFALLELADGGFSVSAIHAMYPHLSLAAIHGALSYAIANRGLMQLERDDSTVDLG